MKVLITGSAGFIGFHLAKQLAASGENEIVGLDIINDYYDVNLKYARLEESGIKREDIQWGVPAKSSVNPNYSFYRIDIADYPSLSKLFKEHSFDYVIHMAAQAGVRYSIDHPHAYIQSNIVGLTHILECCRHGKIKHLIYASSSSVYGENKKIPFAEDDRTDYPISLYAATKKSGELLAHSYSHLFHLPTTGVRLFTAYGPWGRPDMAPMLFAEAIFENRPIQVFNQGNMQRDFTFIDDITDGITSLLLQVPNEESPTPFYQLFNIGNSKPANLMDLITNLEKNIGKTAILDMQRMQPGDVPVTYADISRLYTHTGYTPSITLEEGIPAFVDWLKFYRLRQPRTSQGKQITVSASEESSSA